MVILNAYSRAPLAVCRAQLTRSELGLGATQSKRTEEARATLHVETLQGQLQAAQARQVVATAEVARALERVTQRETKEAEPTADATTTFGEPSPSPSGEPMFSP